MIKYPLLALAALSMGCSSPAEIPANATDSGGGLAIDGSAARDASAADADADAAKPFHAVSAFASVAKVKNVLLGLPPADEEVQRIIADPTQWKPLVQSWMDRPEYVQKMQRFFELAFQQTQVTAEDFADQAYPKQIGINRALVPLLAQNAQESFARTMIAHMRAGRSLSEGFTTRELMMTTALKELYAFLDSWQVNDDGKVTDLFRQANRDLTLTIGTAGGPIPIAQSLDKTSPNYMHWFYPDVLSASKVPACVHDPVELPASGIALHYLLYGSIDGHKNAQGTSCPPYAGDATTALLSPDDFDDWTMVTLRQPVAAEPTTLFYDLPALRKADQLVLSIPREGFFSTPAFFANWQTNVSNQMRVTMNQALIVALGSSVDGTDPTVIAGDPPGLDAPHASPSDCLFCHRTLDPLRSIFAASYSWNYHNQSDSSYAAQKGMFAFRGVIAKVDTIDDFAKTLAAHPLFAEAWAQKLCFYVNSSPCVSADPEFQRIVAAFRASGFSWNVLVAELVSSPITTLRSATETASENGEVIAVARRDHLCASLALRLGLSDVCGLNTVKRKASLVTDIVSGLPSDGYGRGGAAPVLPNDPTLFYRAGIENICGALSTLVVDTPMAKQQSGSKQWSSKQSDAAITEWVSLLMGLTSSDPRSKQAFSILKGHDTSAVQQGESPTDALRSTFVAACVSPSAISIGL